MGVKSKIKNFIYKIHLKNTVLLDKNTTVYKSNFEGYNKVKKNTNFIKGNIGRGSYIGSNCCLSEAKIGRFTSIGDNVRIISGKHPVNIFVSTHPAFYSTRKQAGFTFVNKQMFEEYNKINGEYSVVIGSDVWIGEGVTIMEGVIIGDGAVIGANSLVTKNIEPYSINAGVSTKILKYRYSKEDIQVLLKFKWWNKDFQWIEKNSSLFNNIENLKSYINTKSS